MFEAFNREIFENENDLIYWDYNHNIIPLDSFFDDVFFMLIKTPEAASVVYDKANKDCCLNPWELNSNLPSTGFFWWDNEVWHELNTELEEMKKFKKKFNL